jgi:NAD(P)-dependent dehydrogenase (short-subunit alcohol dehydrogenase family)
MAKTAFITGASTGIGEATAHYFLQRGWNVAATARDPQRIGDWSRAPAVSALQLDVTDEESVCRAIETAIRRFKRIDVLVNNAGIGLTGPLEALSHNDVEALFATNILGPARVIRVLLPHLRQAGGGVIVNVSSVIGRFGFPFQSAYCATKFALEGMTESLRDELKPFGIAMKLVEPGGIKTEFKMNWKEHPAYEPSLSKLKGLIESRRASLSDPEIVAKAIFLASTRHSDRFRYRAADGSLLRIQNILPDLVWRKLLQFLIARRS